MSDKVQLEADRVAKNAATILALTRDEKRIFASITELGKRIYLTNSASIEDVEIITSRALALLTIMRDKK